MISENYLKKAYSYVEYRKLIDDLLIENKTTGTDQREEMIEYAKLNLHRMQRLEKTVVINESLKAVINTLNREIVFLAITEGWCGDAAQNLPVFSFIEKLSSKVSLKLLLRDENTELIDQYLTNGGRSIPKVICIDKNTLEELFVWGPRPESCQNIMLDLKAKNVSLKEKAEAIHLWYARDKTQSLQKEIEELLKNI